MEKTKEVTLNSVFTNDYKNDFGIPADKCYDFFDGFVEDCWEKASNDGHEDQALSLYDNADALYEYYKSLELPFGDLSDSNYEEDDTIKESTSTVEANTKPLKEDEETPDGEDEESEDDSKLDDKTGGEGHKAERPEDIDDDPEIEKPDKDDVPEDDTVEHEKDNDNPLKALPETIEPIIEFPSGNFVYVDWDSKEHKLIAGGATNTGVLKEFELKYDDGKPLNDNLQDLYDLIGKKHPDYLEETTDEGGVTPTEESLDNKAAGIDEIKKLLAVPSSTTETTDAKYLVGDTLAKIQTIVTKYHLTKDDMNSIDKSLFDKNGSGYIDQLKYEANESLTETKKLNTEDKVELYDHKTDDKPYKTCSREEAIKFYKEAVEGTEGSEQERMQSCLIALNNGDAKIYNYGIDECIKEDVNIKDIRSDTKDGDIRPTPEQVQAGKDGGWDGFELKHGYGIFDEYGFEIIERIDDMDVFDGDDEAEEQAKRDGFKFIDLTDKQKQTLIDKYEFLNPALIDTEENRKLLANMDKENESLSEDRDLTKIKGTISSVVSANKDAIFAAGDELAMGKKTIDILNKAIADKALTAGEEGHAKLWIKYNNKFQCSVCRSRTNIKSGTIMEKSKVSIRTWL
jgi:hypothetical protein